MAESAMCLPLTTMFIDLLLWDVINSKHFVQERVRPTWLSPVLCLEFQFILINFTIQGGFFLPVQPEAPGGTGSDDLGYPGA